MLGVLNYLRDRAKIVVELQWDLMVTDNRQYDPNKLWGLIRVMNVGRRPAYISHVALNLPKGYEHTHLLIAGGIAGKKLAEGDSPELYVVSQNGMEKYAKDWQEIVAQVSDSTGKAWRSKRLKKQDVPSWVNNEGSV